MDQRMNLVTIEDEKLPVLPPKPPIGSVDGGNGDSKPGSFEDNRQLDKKLQENNNDRQANHNDRQENLNDRQEKGNDRQDNGNDHADNKRSSGDTDNAVNGPTNGNRLSSFGGSDYPVDVVDVVPASGQTADSVRASDEPDNSLQASGPPADVSPTICDLDKNVPSSDSITDILPKTSSAHNYGQNRLSTDGVTRTEIGKQDDQIAESEMIPNSPSHSSSSPHSPPQPSPNQTSRLAPNQPSPAHSSHPPPSYDPPTRINLVEGSDLNCISVVTVPDSSLRPRRRGSRPRPSLQDGPEPNLTPSNLTYLSNGNMSGEDRDVYRGDGGMYMGDLDMYRSDRDMYRGDEEEKEESESLVARDIPDEPWKTFWAFIFLLCGFLFTSVSLSLTHERLPDYPPLPDVILDNILYRAWGLDVAEYMIIVLASLAFLVVIFHKHRMVVFRRVFLMIGMLYIYRGVTMYITNLPKPDTNYYCSPKLNHTITFLEVMSRSLKIISGGGLSINGNQVYCGDFIFSGHTMALFMAFFIIREYTPRKLIVLHGIALLMAVMGIVFLMLARGHYSIDVLVAYWATSRLFWIYHTLAHTSALNSTGGHNFMANMWWWHGFRYFEGGVRGSLPREYSVPLPGPLKAWVSAPWRRRGGYTPIGEGEI